MKIKLLFTVLFFTSVCIAQNSISGLVTSADNENLFGVNVKIVGDNSGTVTDSNGKFVLKSNKKFPWKVEFSSVGFESKKVNVDSNNQNVSIVLSDEHNKLDEIVISASRTPERIIESPVTIERMGTADIKKSASATFYDGLENLKEVQMNTSSLTFKSINTRGFATVANTRFMQLVDGMDNSSPLLNFVLGNMIGVSEIDVQSVELLPGASSALYGANAFNGIMFMNSKSPFNSPGISTYLKYGQTSQKAAGNNSYYDFGIRMAHAFDKHFAAKFNFTHMEGTDWFATNYDDRTVQGRTRSHQNYDGVNVYGDEVSQALSAVGLSNVSRTGYNETDLTNNKASNTKVDFALHFRPLGDERLEIIWLSKFGLGNAVYQGANRYYLNNFFMQQHKLEVKGKNFFVRGYTTSEDGGESYDMQFTAWNVNRAWKSDKDWFTQYATTYAQAMGGAFGAANANVTSANSLARTNADTGRLIPGTPAFIAAFNKVIADPDILTGSKLVDNSKIYHSDVNYNLKDLIKFGEIQVGGSYRLYSLNSHGRIYTDANGKIDYREYGVYTQLQKKFMEDRMKFTGSIRYDKAQNFSGNYSPRVSLVYAGGSEKQHNFRASFQTGFRNPTTQDQYIGFNVGPAVLVGSAPDNLTRYNEVLPITGAVSQLLANGATVAVDGNNAYYKSYTKSSIDTGNPALWKKTNVGLVKPEEVKAFELGYRSQVKGVYIDLNGYYNIYNNFIGNSTVLAPLYGVVQDAPATPNATNLFTDTGAQSVHAISTGNYRAYQIYTNTPLTINSFGVGVGLSKKMFGDYDFGVNYNYAQFDFDQAQDPGFEAGFNTPKHRVKATVGNTKLFKNFGFNTSVRWNESYLWQSTMADGMISAATVVDAQINYGLPSLKSVVKFGATNIGGKEYTQVLGAGSIGHQYFVSWTLNP
ncbi:TonB-dependent receptor [Flavobacterium ovatum]|uniref:TonB-dependent receptor domain-containing protein n=1 Tax=Flavobacterium ovatum TaxID=1928857 RepID=UPI00344D310F